MKRSTSVRASCWPDEDESLLLQAGLADKTRAVAAWEKFCRRHGDIETLPESCYRLLPLVAGHLQDIPTIPNRERISGVLRHAWFRNQQLLGRTLPFLAALQSAGCDFLLLKGAALAEDYRREGSVRPMVDIDLLVRPEAVARALDVLLGLGCRTRGEICDRGLEALLQFRHELTLDTPTGGTLDLHWHLVADARHPETQENLWKRAVPCRLGSLQARTLDRADQLLHACLHGAVWNDISPVRWLADSVMLIRAGVDWSRVEEEARRLERLEPVRETIRVLDALEVGLPAEQATHWRELKLTRLERAEGSHRARRPDSRARTKHLAWLFLRLHRGESFGAILRRIPSYMRQVHHFRAYSRRVAFLFYLAVMGLTHSSRSGRLFRRWATH